MTWVARFPAAHADALGPLRATVDLEFARDGDAAWLRGSELTDAVRRGLRAVPSLELFEEADRRLRPFGRVVATAELPSVEFRPIAAALPLEPPPITTGAVELDRVPITLARGGEPLPPRLLSVAARDWYQYAVTAPQARLAPLRFAATRGQAIIEGDPLPPIRGTRYSLRHRLALPLGFRFAPIDAPSLIADELTLGDDEVALFAVDAEGSTPDRSVSYVRLEANHWVAASRSAVRQTWKFGFDE